MTTPDIKEKVREVLNELSPDEQVLLTRIIQIEQGMIHMPDNKVLLWKDDLLKALREVIK